MHFAPGDITYIVDLVVESMVWLDDFSNSGSLAYQQLAAKFQKAVSYSYIQLQLQLHEQKLAS